MTNVKAKASNPADIFGIDPVAASEKGTDLELLLPGVGDPLGVFLCIVGSESKDYKAHVRTKSIERAKRNLTKAKAKKSDDEQAAELVDNMLSDDVSIGAAHAGVVGWWRFKDIEKREGRIDTLLFQGEELEFSKPALLKVLTERPWIAHQAHLGIEDLSRFMTG